MRFLLLLAATSVLLISCGGSKTETNTPLAASSGTTQSMTRTDAVPLFYVDQVGTASNPSPDKEISVPAAEPLVVSGWAANLGGELVSGVEIAVDQKPYLAAYGRERGDVAAALKNPSYNKSGFQFSIPLSQLSNGTHAITVRIINKGRNAYFETPAFHVRVQ